MIKSYKLSCLSLFICIAFPAWAQTGPATPDITPLRLSRQDAIREALAHNPGIVAAREQVAQARASVVIAGAIPDPVVQLDVAGQSHALKPSSSNADDQGIDFAIPFPGKTGMRRAVATADLRAAEYNLTQLRQQVASDTAQAYDAILVALQHEEDLEQGKQLSSEFLAKTRERFKGGTVPKLDVLKAKVDLAQAGNELIANQRVIATSRAALNRVLGRLAGAPIDATDSLEVPDQLPPVETLQKIAERSRPELAGLLAERKGARTATRLAKKYWQPDVDLIFTRNAAQGSPDSFTTELDFGIPLFFWQHKKGEVAAAQHRESELDADRKDLEAQVSLDVASAFATASTALRQAIFIRDELLPEAHEVYRVASVSYGLGGLSALELLDAKRQLLDAESQYADALGNANDARAALELAIGAPLPTANTGVQQ